MLHCLQHARFVNKMRSGTLQLFVIVLFYQVRSSPQSPALLLLDNHESHLSIAVLDYAKTNGVVMLSFPPHCSHRLQPLDRTVFGPFKKFYNVALKDLLVTKTAHRPDIW